RPGPGRSRAGGRDRRRVACRRGRGRRPGCITRICRLAPGGDRRDVTWLVLFDVDGTLLLTHDEVYVEANRLALTEVYGEAPEGADVPGDTATAHTRRALAAAGFTAREIDAGLSRWCEAFSAHYVRLLAGADTSQWQLGP